MKQLHKINFIIGLLIAVIGLVSCEKGFDELNRPYKDADVETASIPGLFNGLVSTMANYNGDANMASSLLNTMANQQAVQNTQVPILNTTSAYWSQYYPDLLTYNKLLKKISEQSVPQSFDNVKHMATTLMAYRTLRMLDCYGDIPYSQASRADENTANYRPSYDKQADVYKLVLAGLEAASNGLKVDQGQVSIGASESFLSGNIDQWKKFCNALRLRYAVRLYNKEQALATAIITDILNNNKPLPNNQAADKLWEDNFGFWSNRVTGTKPFGALTSKWDAYRETSISNIRMSSNIWGQMSSSNNPNGSGIFDPRCYVYYMTNNADQWVPQPQTGSPSDGGHPYDKGDPTRKPIGSDPNNKFAAINYFLAYDREHYPILYITEADVHFLKAEIYQRGMGVGKNIALAKAEYEAGITASVNFWYAYTQLSAAWLTKPATPTPAQMTALLTNPLVMYNGANDADALKKIATQAWIATAFEPAECWAIVRRTGLTPKDPAYSPAATYKLPYPDDEKTNNAANWQQATGGADPTAQMQVKPYWMP